MVKIRKLIPILLAVWPYTILLEEWIQGAVVPVYLLVTLMIVVANFIHVFYLARNWRLSELAFWSMVLKLAHIPYFLPLGLTLFSLLFISIVPTFALLVPMIMGILLLISYILLLITSTYGLVAIYQGRKQNTLSKFFAVSVAILHLMFVGDVIGACLNYLKTKKLRDWNKKK